MELLILFFHTPRATSATCTWARIITHSGTVRTSLAGIRGHRIKSWNLTFWHGGSQSAQNQTEVHRSEQFNRCQGARWYLYEPSTFAVRWIVKPKPLVDNMLSASRCYSSLNCINVACRSGETVCLCVWFVCFRAGSGTVRAHPSQVAVGGLFICCFEENWHISRILKTWAAAARDRTTTNNTLFTFASPLLTHNTGLGGRYYIALTAHTIACC